MPKEIDYVPEDNDIPGQRYALISIVGPHMPQKCDTWAIKVRGVVDTIDQAKALSKKIINYDNDFDIFTAEVGKFFPLNVEPLQVDEVEYQNEQLNNLMKKYYQNKEHTTQQWNERKKEMMKAAVKEGMKDVNPVREHAIVVLQRIKDSSDHLDRLTEELENARTKLQKAKELYATYSSEERTDAEKLMNTNSEPTVKGVESASTSTLAPIAEEEDVNDKVYNVTAVLAKLRTTDEQIDKLENAESQSLESHLASSNLLQDLKRERYDLVSKLDAKTVNEYINKNYQGSEHNYLLDASPR